MSHCRYVQKRVTGVNVMLKFFDEKFFRIFSSRTAQNCLGSNRGTLTQNFLKNSNVIGDNCFC